MIVAIVCCQIFWWRVEVAEVGSLCGLELNEDVVQNLAKTSFEPRGLNSIPQNEPA
jgi:hypothetical protein